MVVATAKGRHYYFLARDDHPLGNEEGAFGDYSINIRAGNGFVVGPGSFHETGVVYRSRFQSRPRPSLIGYRRNQNQTNGQKTTTADGLLFEDVGGFEPFELPEVIKEHHQDTTLFSSRALCGHKGSTAN
jgi:hypothetical protein